ncbi:hypothetical protein EV363DRAFT_1394646 [Boletus edulis]|nr:hypothetical protein EV363DRAFT_1394646 [Boletus edulis]
MERHPGRLVEQFQVVQFRQRKSIQQLQAENARRLSDLVDVRQERDTFRKEVARLRKDNAELQSRLEEVLIVCQDLKRERQSRCVASAGHTRNANLGLKLLNTLSVLDEEQNESTADTTIAATTVSTAGFALLFDTPVLINIKEKVPGCPKLEQYLYRKLPDLPMLEPHVHNSTTPCPKQSQPTVIH